MRRLLTAVVATILLSRAALGQCQGWLQQQPGTNFNDAVYAMTTWDSDGAGPLPAWLIVAGDFTSTGAVAANRIAAWDGSVWRAFDTGINGPVFALGSYNGELIAAGVFSQAGSASVSNIARYRVGQGWRAVGTGVFNGPIYAVAEFRGELVVGGDFYYQPGPNGGGTYHFMRWNSAAWRTVDGSVGEGPCFSLLATQDSLYVAGRQYLMRNVGGFLLFQPLGPVNVIGNFWALTLHSGELVAGGDCAFSSGAFISRILLPSGEPLGLVHPPQNTVRTVDGPVSALASHNGTLFLGGSFLNIPGVAPAPRCARWNSTTGWSPMGVGTNGPVLSMCAYGSEVFVGGAFTEAGGPGRGGAYLARWTDLASPTITQQPSAVNAAGGTAATFSVAAISAQGGVAYSWRHDGNPVQNGAGGVSPTGGVVSGADGPTLTITNVLQSDAGVFTCVVSNGCAAVTSSPATLVVTPECEPDFNHDGNVDQDDVIALIGVVAGGDCP